MLGVGGMGRLCVHDCLQKGKVSGKEILRSLQINAEVAIPPLPPTTPTFPSFSSSNDDQNQVKAPRAGGSASRELLLGRRAPALSCAHSQAHLTYTRTGSHTLTNKHTLTCTHTLGTPRGPAAPAGSLFQPPGNRQAAT